MNTTTTFEAHGHTWTKHTPGDPMPCDKKAEVFILLRSDKESFQQCAAPADSWWWSKDSGTGEAHFEIIGWRFSTHPQEKDELTSSNQAAGDLLARIHGDGGHYQSEHGLVKTANDAENIVVQLQSQRDELTRLREENASMLTAIKEGHTALEKALFVHKAITTYTKQSDADFTANMEHCGILAEALATLQPFTQPQ